jgi:hypothetical protein
MWQAWERRVLHAGLYFENKKSHSEDIGLYGNIILKWISNVTIWCGGDTSLVQYRYHWLAPINTVKNFGFRKMRGIS